MDKYFIVFKIEWGMTKGRELAHLLDMTTCHPLAFGRIIRGFRTKKAMQDFAQKYELGFRESQMLKPIS